MTNPTESDWYLEMAAAMKRRDHSLRMIERWTKVRQEAEAEIQNLFTQQNTEDARVQE